MLSERIIGAFTFRTEVYAEVENDVDFTTTAWMIVAVVAFLNQVAANLQSNLFRWLLGSVIGTIVALIGFALAVAIISWTGREVFYAKVSFDELVRTLGLASVWSIFGAFGSVVGLFKGLACLTWPVFLIAGVLGLAAWALALKEALDLEWVQTIVTAVIGFVVWLVLQALTRGVFALLGYGVRAFT